MRIEKTAYGRIQHAHDPALTEVGPGTPAGELLRRFWQPVALVADVGQDPIRVRILGEDLVLFRDLGGRLGLFTERCCHRGTSLFYGRIEQRGMRCCYHGWHFDVDGVCLEMPCEPPGSQRRTMVRQPWYPVREYCGLVFAYLGPPERVPALPRFDCIEAAAADPRKGVLACEGYGSGGHFRIPSLGVRTGDPVLPANWLQFFENSMDPFHALILHMRMTGEQFAAAMGIVPEVSWNTFDQGVCSVQERRLPNGALFRRITEARVPNVRIVASPGAGEEGVGYEAGGTVTWVVPIDDVTTTFFTLEPVRVRDDGSTLMPRRQQFPGGRAYEELTPLEHQRFPGDFEAQVSQGRIAIHRDEHLVASDGGIMMLRRKWAEESRCVAAGGDPAGAVIGQADISVATLAGNFLLSRAGEG